MRINWNDKTVLITGGTGSFGKQLTSLLLTEYRPKKLIIFSRDEMKQFTMRTEGFDSESIRYFIGDMRDKERLYRALYPNASGHHAELQPPQELAREHAGTNLKYSLTPDDEKKEPHGDAPRRGTRS